MFFQEFFPPLVFDSLTTPLVSTADSLIGLPLIGLTPFELNLDYAQLDYLMRHLRKIQTNGTNAALHFQSF